MSLADEKFLHPRFCRMAMVFDKFSDLFNSQHRDEGIGNFESGKLELGWHGFGRTLLTRGNKPQIEVNGGDFSTPTYIGE